MGKFASWLKNKKGSPKDATRFVTGSLKPPGRNRRVSSASLKYIAVIAGVLTISVLAGLVYVNFGKVKQTEYVSEEFGYRFFYPEETWHKANEQELNEINVVKRETDLRIQDAVIKNDDKDTVFGLIVQEMPGAKKLDREQSIDKMDEENSDRHNSFKKVRAEEIDFLGLEAIDYEIEYGFIRGFRGSEQRRHERQIIFLANEKIYRLIFSSLPENYKEDKGSFNGILKSFKLLDT